MDQHEDTALVRARQVNGRTLYEVDVIRRDGDRVVTGSASGGNLTLALICAGWRAELPRQSRWWVDLVVLNLVILAALGVVAIVVKNLFL